MTSGMKIGLGIGAAALGVYLWKTMQKPEPGPLPVVTGQKIGIPANGVTVPVTPEGRQMLRTMQRSMKPKISMQSTGQGVQVVATRPQIAAPEDVGIRRYGEKIVTAGYTGPVSQLDVGTGGSPFAGGSPFTKKTLSGHKSKGVIYGSPYGSPYGGTGISGVGGYGGGGLKP